MRKNNKAQVSFEIMITLSIALVLITGVAALAYTYLIDNRDQQEYYKKISQCKKLANIIEETSLLNEGFEYMTSVDTDLDMTPSSIYAVNKTGISCSLNVKTYNELGLETYSLKKGYIRINIINGNTILRNTELLYITKQIPNEEMNTPTTNLVLTTNQNSNCKLDATDKDYSLMTSTFTNINSTHNITLNLNIGNNLFYTKCQNTGYTMNTSYQINIWRN